MCVCPAIKKWRGGFCKKPKIGLFLFCAVLFFSPRWPPHLSLAVSRSGDAFHFFLALCDPHCLPRFRRAGSFLLRHVRRCRCFIFVCRLHMSLEKIVKRQRGRSHRVTIDLGSLIGKPRPRELNGCCMYFEGVYGGWGRGPRSFSVSPRTGHAVFLPCASRSFYLLAPLESTQQWSGFFSAGGAETFVFHEITPKRRGGA